LLDARCINLPLLVAQHNSHARGTYSPHCEFHLFTNPSSNPPSKLMENTTPITNFMRLISKHSTQPTDPAAPAPAPAAPTPAARYSDPPSNTPIHNVSSAAAQVAAVPAEAGAGQS
jgi:hypothetical protein